MANGAQKVGRGRCCPGFSLIELLVVIVIIALIIGIVLPALGHVKDLAKRTATDSFVNEISGACSQFRNDNRRMPGYFSARDMGSVANGTRGMSGAENLLLDLALPKAAMAFGNAPPNANYIEVGPVAGVGANRVWVDPAQVGAAGTYLVLSGSHLVAQVAGTQQIADIQGHASSNENDPQLKDLVDDWGNPLLVWSMDEAYTNPVQNIDDFARIAYGGPNQASRFYLNQNTCFLNSPSLGKKAANQTDALKGSILSTIPGGNAPNRSLGGLLGNPASLRSEDAQANVVDMMPTQSRGLVVIQSAGSNGVYLGRNERGAKAASYILDFGLNYKSRDNTPNQNGAGVNQALDVLQQGFDDRIASVGN